MRHDGQTVQKSAVSSRVLANVKIIGAVGEGYSVQAHRAIAWRILSAGLGLLPTGFRCSDCGLVSSFGGLDFSVGGIDFSIGGFRKSIGGFETPWPYPCAGRAIQYAIHLPKKCFNLSADLCLTLSISNKEAEGFEKRTLQPLSAKTGKFHRQKQAVRGPHMTVRPGRSLCAERLNTSERFEDQALQPLFR